ncbi:MAG: 3-isopropylmalate dehydratase small subunit [Deltaproteobacteria bacterium HGW-Deltaproteobacteria-15]|jgi:3-isopropylmalate/(R)-2-methylmalate dehydratase small subunit|nr:MAG: 3-isopropylmalate dehydratase small subunit [Deltaproteobacteria bacterium HGW-Deltaproteobacteria-15]
MKKGFRVETLNLSGGMMKAVCGKAWKFGNDLTVDKDIFPFRFVLQLSNGVPLKDVAVHLMEPVDPGFGKNVRKGDFLVAGANFGLGKAHSEGVEAMKILGLSAIIADSVAPGFLRSAIYNAMPILTGEGLSEKITQGDDLEVNPDTGRIRNLSTGEFFDAKPAIPPDHPLYPIMKAGGQIEYIRQRVASSKKGLS